MHVNELFLPISTLRLSFASCADLTRERRSKSNNSLQASLLCVGLLSVSFLEISLRL